VKRCRRELYTWLKYVMSSIPAKSARATRKSKNKHIRHHDLPENRPKMTPTEYGASPSRYEGLFLGSPAHDVWMEPIDLDVEWNIRFDEVSHLEGGDLLARGFHAVTRALRL
jgi:hypothetical protein